MSSSLRASLPYVHLTCACPVTFGFFFLCHTHCPCLFLFVCVCACEQWAVHVALTKHWFVLFFVLFLASWTKAVCVCVSVWELCYAWILDDWCVCVRMSEDCCMNVCETMGKFSLADSLWWGWGSMGGRWSWRSCPVFWVAKKILFTRAEILRWIFSVSDPKCLCSQMFEFVYSALIIIKRCVCPNWQPLHEIKASLKPDAWCKTCSLIYWFIGAVISEGTPEKFLKTNFAL